MPSRPSLLRRLAALALTGGLLLSTVGAGVHDPTCPHHAGGGMDARGDAHGGHPGHGPSPVPPAHAEAPAAGPGHRVAHDAGRPTGHAPVDAGGEDCRCLGGLCALSAVVDPPLPEQAAAVADPVVTARATPAEADLTPAREAPHLLPPSTGPPTTI